MKTKVRTTNSIGADIFFNQPTSVIAFDPDLKVITCNKSFGVRAGVNPLETEGLNVLSFIGNEPQVKELVDKALGGKICSGLIWVNGKRVEADFGPLIAEEGLIGVSVTLGQEVTGSHKLNYLSKSGFKSVIEQAPVTIMIFKSDGSVFYTNQHYKELWGLTERELYLIHEYYNIFEDPQLTNQSIGSYIKKAFEGNNVELPVIQYKMDYSGLGRKNALSKENWLMGYFYSLQHPEFDDGLTALIFVDITREIDAERAFKKSQERLEMALEGGELGTWDWDLESDAIVYNSQWAKMLGYDLDEMDVLSWEKLVHPDDVSWVKERLNNHIAGYSNSYEAEYRIQNKLGEWKWVLDRGKVVEFTDEGTAKRFSGTHLDITNQKEIELQTLKAEQLLSQLFENAPMGIVMLGFDDEILKVNKGFEKIFGYGQEEILGKYINDVIVPPERMKEGQKLSKDSAKGKIVYFETERLNKNREPVAVMIYTLPVMYNGQRLGVYGIYVDIRKRMKVEEELKVRNLELDNFVYKVSHDLRAPLASILGLINLIKLEGGMDQNLDYLDLMENQVHKLDHFIHDVLSHSKNLKMSVITSTIDFEDIITKCITDLSYLQNSERVKKTISVELSDFKSDKWRINEIFRNLIANTIKYQDLNKKESFMDIIIRANKEECLITIKDNGIGIKKESLPHIFEMFYRATVSSNGSGIGLYIVKNAIDKLNGKIEIESNFGEGTTFNIWLPALEA
ncbi:MAG: PAS domain-containing sensor histidine kinase [Cyclobacteriaceae bacterium]|nr:PAS domain-containing sensor histidine kinase [Cyclobacteriaceae bacterium]